MVRCKPSISGLISQAPAATWKPAGCAFNGCAPMNRTAARTALRQLPTIDLLSQYRARDRQPMRAMLYRLRRHRLGVRTAGAVKVGITVMVMAAARSRSRRVARRKVVRPAGIALA